MNTMAIAHHFNHIVDLTADDDGWSPGDYYCTGRPQPYPPIPLSLELVMNGQSFRSTAPLFQFPLEVLTLIVEQVPSSCLKNVALVNSDVSNGLFYVVSPHLCSLSPALKCIVPKLREHTTEAFLDGLTNAPSSSANNLPALVNSLVSILVTTRILGPYLSYYTKNTSTSNPPRIRLTVATLWARVSEEPRLC